MLFFFFFFYITYFFPKPLLITVHILTLLQSKGPTDLGAYETVTQQTLTFRELVLEPILAPPVISKRLCMGDNYGRSSVCMLPFSRCQWAPDTDSEVQRLSFSCLVFRIVHGTWEQVTSVVSSVRNRQPLVAV